MIRYVEVSVTLYGLGITSQKQLDELRALINDAADVARDKFSGRDRLGDDVQTDIVELAGQLGNSQT